MAGFEGKASAITLKHNIRNPTAQTHLARNLRVALHNWSIVSK
jgi:hypothetical protein